MRTVIASLCLTAACLFLLSGCGFFGGSSDSDTPSYQAQQALRAACSQVGKPYRLGGASPKQGFDCSGLIYWAYQTNGVEVPRRTTEQMRSGYDVTDERLLPGDIVVFRMSRNNLHTGLYAGGNTFVHSPRKGSSVRMESMDKPYWTKRLVTVRRVVG